MKTGRIIISLSAFAAVAFLASCKTKEAAANVDGAAEGATEEAARYGEDAADAAADATKKKDNRFGYAGYDAEEKAESAEKVVENKKREFRDMADSERDSLNNSVNKASDKVEEVVKAPEPPKPPKTTGMTIANKVPGDPLSVTLPGKHASLGQISVERYDSSGQPTGQPLPSGTPVEIPDPNSPGQKIFFKVP